MCRQLTRSLGRYFDHDRIDPFKPDPAPSKFLALAPLALLRHLAASDTVSAMTDTASLPETYCEGFHDPEVVKKMVYRKMPHYGCGSHSTQKVPRPA